MSVMSTATFSNETYYCNECEKTLASSDINEWRCLFCDERVQIDAGLTQKIMRKRPEEVVEGDTFVMHHTGEFLEVLGIVKKKKKVDYRLKDYGTFPQVYWKWVNCMFAYE